MKGLHTASHLRFEEMDGIIVFLDLRTGTYHAMDSVAARMWKSIQKFEERTSIVQSLHHNHPVELERLERDLDAFIEQLLKLGFLEKETSATPEVKQLSTRRGIRYFPALRAWWYLMATACSLSLRGFAGTYARCSNLSVARLPAEMERDSLALALRAFGRAENFFYLRKAPKDCLPRSLALFRFLRAMGFPVEHCIGVKRFPFSAHAWVENDGEVIYDHSGRPGGLTTLARMPR